ncbi:MAG: lipoyl(octanoyl) transferase LipB [Chloroflexota bacterium]|nr:lipoyl(octanoyl) transferase LipB [Chloroflexota bacterium]
MPEALEGCDYAWLGRVEYREAWDFQRELARRRALGEVPDTLLLLEHPPVYTTGRRGPGANLRLPEASLGAPLIETDRGGDITFHGPGQLVAYPIIDLRAAGLTVVSYVRLLEETIIRTLRAYGIEAQTECGLTGVWVGESKIAAIGVRVGKPAGAAGGWITGHGLALNVDVDLGWFERIVPCGIVGRGVTSILVLTGYTSAITDVAQRLANDFGTVFERRMNDNTALTLAAHPLRAV